MTKIKDALILFAITVIAGFLLGEVNEVTKEPIARQEVLKMAKAYQVVSPQAQSFEQSDALLASLGNAEGILAGSSANLGNVQIEDAVEALDASGNQVGYVVKATSKDGYAGAITLAVGISLDGTLTGIDFLTINETAGLGMKAAEDAFKNQFKDINVDVLKVTKNGASAEGEIDALSGATYTSNATANAVNAALLFASACGNEQEVWK